MGSMGALAQLFSEIDLVVFSTPKKFPFAKLGDALGAAGDIGLRGWSNFCPNNQFRLRVHVSTSAGAHDAGAPRFDST